ncbi:MAG: carbohydate-binding domain-containing protein [Gloeobacteraceae cyanobacterium ES-bin-316]|nr:carbohydate-binding domain-containing protein [Ferruginibacter sp.]
MIRKFVRLSFAPSIKYIYCGLVILSASFIPKILWAQKINSFDVKQVSVSFSAINNNYQNSNQALASLVLSNNGKKNLPATGWKIYFNLKSMIAEQNKGVGVTIKKQRGNLFELSPTTSFKGIAGGENYSLQVLVDGPIINKNDQPEGFYLLWDNAPTKGYDISFTVNKAPLQTADGRFISDFAETVYKRNAALDNVNEQVLIKVFPTPLNYSETNDFFEINNNTSIISDEIFIKEAGLLASDLQKILNKKPLINAAVSGKFIYLQKKEGLAEEAYELTINQDAVSIKASTGAGVFYGIQSFKTVLPLEVWRKKNTTIPVPGITVKDEPRFDYRGMSLDVARNFQTKNEVLRILDLLALYKINTFHFHLTDDEGWRLQIDGLPELTSLAANRGHSLDEKNNMPPAYGSGADTGKLYGSGYYTKADFIEVLQYAHARHIKVITEIETPGHARAAIKAMDARYQKFMQSGKRAEALQYFLRDTLDASEYSTPQWYHDNVINVALPSVYNFIEKIATEIEILYKQAGVPLTTLHFGGDEVPTGTWEKSPLCKELIKNNPAIENTNGLWYYYLAKVNSILKAKGIALSGWEEIGLRKTELDGKKIMIPNPGFANDDMRLYVWNNIDGNEDLAYRLANAGYKIILTCVTNFYLDMVHFKTYDEPGYYWGSITDISKAYEFIPFDYFKNVQQDHRGNPINRSAFLYKQRLTDYGKKNVIGLQAAIWSETIKGPQQLEYMLLPRLAALSERAWAKDPGWAVETDTAKMQRDYQAALSGFLQQVGKRQLPMLDYYNSGYNYRIPPAGAILKNESVWANTQFPGLSIRYTSDNTEPHIKSAPYTQPILSKGIIKLKVFNEKGRESYTTVIENK